MKQINSIKFFTLGCKANQYDTQSIRERFLEKGFLESVNPKKSDYFLINTCTVTSGADQKSRNTIRKCARMNPAAKIIVTGCLVEKDSALLAPIKGADLFIKKSFFPEGISSFSGHTRAFLKIQDGCANFCSYCKVAYVRGKERSKALNVVRDEAKKLVSCGYKEIVLTGICLGAYGKGLAYDLVDAIKELEKIPQLARIRLSSIEAGDISPRLIKYFKTSKKLCCHLHIPIQSGDDQILKLMNRKYNSKKYLGLITRLKKEIPGLSITTDCLVGFPGETEENFRNSCDLIKKIMPLKVHIFPYSSRPGTKATDFKGAIDPLTIKKRCVLLKKLTENLTKSFMRKFVSKKVSVLIEGNSKDEPGFMEGLTDNYLSVKVPYKPGLKNRIVSVKIKCARGSNLIGEIIDNS